MPDPSISVALCTYNGARFLREQLVSIASQTLQPMEIVVCDDGSTDGTIGVIKDFAATAGMNVRIYQNERNLGSTKNFEKVVSLCAGEFIALSDQDDQWKPNKLEVLTGALCRSGAGAAFSDAELMDGDSHQIPGTLWIENRFRGLRSELNHSRSGAVSELLKRNVVTGATVVFRESLRKILLPFPTEWVHDGWLAWMCVLYSSLIAIPECLMRYRVHGRQQEGVPGSVLDRFRRARTRGMEDSLRVVEQFRVLLRFLENDDRDDDLMIRSLIEGKIRNTQFRAQLDTKRLPRLFQILLESPAYLRFTQGWLSMAKDAIL